MDDKVFLWFFRVGGVLFTARTICAKRDHAMTHARWNVAARNARVPSEKTEFVKLFEVGRDITSEQADKLEADNRLRKRIAGQPAPEDIDPDFPNRMFHEPFGSAPFNPFG